jgi:hypothetical protein
MKRLLKKCFYTVAPQAATAFFSARSRAHSHRVVQQWGAARLNSEIISRYGRRVLSGPFQGMELTAETEKELLGPYLLGTFELEIQPWIEAACQGSYSVFVDVGAKFGFYSVGFAKRAPSIPSLAFDTDSWARKAMRQMTEANSTRNVEILGYCSREWIVEKLPPNSFVLSDCEGYEAVLFEDVSPSLKSATLLIETHDHEVENTSVMLKSRFAATHHIEEVFSGISRTSPVDLSFLNEKDQQKILHETRLEQSWLLLKPREKQSH